MSTTTHQHPAVGDVFKDAEGEAKILSIRRDGSIVMKRKTRPQFVISNNGLMGTDIWKNQCPICHPPETEPAPPAAES